MRVGFYGNVCNNLYQIAKALRAHASIDAHLFLDVRSHLQQLPESDDPELTVYPDWIHLGRYSSRIDQLFPWRSAIVRELAACDLVVVAANGPSFSQFAHRPTAFLTAGGDLTIDPFPFQLWFAYKRLSLRLAGAYLALWQRRGIRSADRVWTQPFAPFQDALRRLGIPRERVSRAYFPVMIDTARLREHPDPWNSGVAAVREMKSRFDFVVFHPSRMMIRDGAGYRRTGQWKANDVLFRAFRQFVKRDRPGRPGLVMIDRGSREEIARAKRILSELRLETSTLWLQPPRAEGFTRDELMALYSAADVVADDFGAGWFGSVVLEGLAAARPVLCYVDEAAMGQLYPDHPLFSSNTVDGNAEILSRLYRYPALRRDRGKAGRRWLETHHSQEAVTRIYVEQFQELMGGLSDGGR